MNRRDISASARLSKSDLRRSRNGRRECVAVAKKRMIYTSAAEARSWAASLGSLGYFRKSSWYIFRLRNKWEIIMTVSIVLCESERASQRGEKKQCQTDVSENRCRKIQKGYRTVWRSRKSPTTRAGLLVRRRARGGGRIHCNKYRRRCHRREIDIEQREESIPIIAIESILASPSFPPRLSRLFELSYIYPLCAERKNVWKIVNISIWCACW